MISDEMSNIDLEIFRSTNINYDYVYRSYIIK